MSTDLFFEDVDLGDRLPTLEFQFTPENVRALVKVWWPEREATRFDSIVEARKEGFPRPIVPSHLSMAYLANVVMAWADNIELKRIDTICRQVLFNDDRVTCAGFVVDKTVDSGQPFAHVDLVLESQRGERALTASARVLVPHRPGAPATPGLSSYGSSAPAATASKSSPAEQGLELDYDRSVIGVEHDLGTYAVTEDRLVSYARAVGAKDPIYWDREAAARGRYGGLVAYPTFISICGFRGQGPHGPDVKLNFGTTGQEASMAVENFLPVRPGDVLRVISKATEVYAKTGRSGTMVFTAFEEAFYNQRGEKAAAVNRAVVRF